MLKLKYLKCLTPYFYLSFHILRCLFSPRSWLLLRLFSQIPCLSYSSDLCISFGPFLPLEFSVLQWNFAFYSGPYPTNHDLSCHVWLALSGISGYFNFSICYVPSLYISSRPLQLVSFARYLNRFSSGNSCSLPLSHFPTWCSVFTPVHQSLAFVGRQNHRILEEYWCQRLYYSFHFKKCGLIGN